MTARARSKVTRPQSSQQSIDALYTTAKPSLALTWPTQPGENYNGAAQAGPQNATELHIALRSTPQIACSSQPAPAHLPTEPAALFQVQTAVQCGQPALQFQCEACQWALKLDASLGYCAAPQADERVSSQVLSSML